MGEHVYIAIDLKSFYASVECAERGLDPLDTNLVVADVSRTEKTICLAVSPSLKAYGISGRARLFEVVQRVRDINDDRRRRAPGGKLVGESCSATELVRSPQRAVSYIAAKPRMALYMRRSTEIYQIYLRHVAPEDIHVYSIDEVFIDATGYLRTTGFDAHGFALMLVREVLAETGITATAGIGTNLYLAKVAMDIVAKHAEPDMDGVRIAELDEMSYRRQLWGHRPLTDFWRVGRGYARKLEANGIRTMGDIARCSLSSPTDPRNEDFLYKLFGVNAELLIDHAWGWEPCTMADIKAYRPESTSLGAGQVLTKPYTFDAARLVVREMAEQLALDLLEKRLVTDMIVLNVGYDRSNLEGPSAEEGYRGTVTTDWYGRRLPKPAHGTARLDRATSSARLISDAVMGLYDSVVDPQLTVRRMNLTAGNLLSEDEEAAGPAQGRLDLFADEREGDEGFLKRERRRQETVLEVRKKFGKNALLKGVDLSEDATARDRNSRIGGHLA